MKTKLYLFGLFSLSVLLILSCQKEDSTPAPVDSTPASMNAKLKQVLLYSTLDSKEPMSIVGEYEYDEAGRISKVSDPMYINGTITGTHEYDLYNYNSLGQLIKINHYTAKFDSPEFTNLKNTSYEYLPDGKKMIETIEYPLAGISEYSDFEYANGILSKTSKYWRNKLESYIVYEYDNSNKLIKELFYTADGKCLTYTTHTYTGSLQTKSDFYVFSTNDHFRSVNRFFDKNNNILTLESKELKLYSNALSCVFRYEYY